MANITKEQVKHVADLARLTITDEEAEKFTEDLRSFIAHTEMLNEVDTSEVEPMTHVLDLVNVMREDKPVEWTSQEEALKNAPDQKDGQIRVPSIILNN